MNTSKNYCPECEGEGHFYESDCCGSEMDIGICFECKEYCEPAKCENCNGTGLIN